MSAIQGTWIAHVSTRRIDDLVPGEVAIGRKKLRDILCYSPQSYIGSKGQQE